MNFKNKALAVLFVAMAAPAAFGQVAAVPDMNELCRPFGAEDVSAFAKPPEINYPQTWFHLIGGNVSAAGITEDLEAIAGAGISGVQLFHGQFGGPWPGVEPQITALSPTWDDVVKHAASEARRLGLRFTMQNCSGWATSGGPWIEPSNAMRHLVWSRTDVAAGDTGVTLPVAAAGRETWRDYRDVAVLAFPTPLDDTGDFLKPLSVESNREAPWKEVLCAANGSFAQLPPCDGSDPVRIEVTFPEAVVVRTIELPSMNSINHPRCYEPGITLTVEAVAPDGSVTQVLHGEVPSANSQDNTPVSFACSDGIATAKYRITIVNRYDMTLRSLKLYTAARKNCWESEAGWTLRNLERANAHPVQNPAAYVSRERIVDITASMKDDGTLDWTVPEGRWTILRIGHVNTGRRNSPAPPEGTGWECNKLSPDGAKAQFAGYIGRLNDGPLAGGLLGGMLLDSWECETQTWTAGMEAEFAKKNDYELRSWLPAVLGFVVGDQETTARFLRDWRGTISDLFVENFYGTMAGLAKKRGLTITYETAAGDVFPADILEYYKYADVPMCEFWQPFTDGFVGSLNFKPIKPTASAARFYGKPRVAAEAFTSFSHTWDEHWSMLKEVANTNLVEGVTHLVYHTYTHNPQRPFLPPGTSFGGPGIGTPFLRGQTWWKHMPAINDYFARCSYMMERGWPVSDIIWYLGDELSPKPDQDPDLLRGYKYDYCNPDILMNRLRVEDGRFVTPDGIEYSVLWLPDNCRMLPETLEKILAFVRSGATVIGDAPQGLATLNGGKAAQRRFDKAVKGIWGSNVPGVRKVGRGRVISGLPVAEALAAAGIAPDVRGDALWAHRRTEGADWYFVCPQKGAGFSGTMDFRCTGRAEIWNPATGERRLAEASASGGRTRVMLDLPQSGACYVVFRRDADTSEPLRPDMTRWVALGATRLHDWTLRFPAGWGAPGELKLSELKPWKELDIPEEGRAFSGTAVYETTFEMPEIGRNLSYVLDLGRVEMIAAVTVNGCPVQTLWAPPYRVEITDYLRPGKNTLVVDVTNTWFNRLVYDAGKAPEERKTWVIRWPSPDEPLRDGGLLGPVRVDVVSMPE